MKNEMTIPKTPLRFVFFAARQSWGWGVAAILSVTFAQLCGVSLPFILKIIIDLAQDPALNPQDIGLWVLLFPCTMLLMFGFYRFGGFMGMEWLTRSETFAYRVLFEHLTKHSHGYFSNRFAGSISNKVHNASEGTYRLMDGTLWGHYGAFLSLVASGVLFFITDVRVGLVYVSLICILIPVNFAFVSHRRPFVVEHAAQKTRLRGVAVDIVTNINAVRQFSRGYEENSRVSGVVGEVRSAEIRQWRISEWALVTNSLLVVGMVGAVLYFMYHGWLIGQITSGDFVLVLSLILSLSSTLMSIGSAMNHFIRVYGEVEEGLDEILLPYEVTDGASAVDLEVPNGEIVWSSVTFTYDENRVFDDFNLTIKPGERVGLVGSSGAGKTTFVSLLLRQHDITSGAIRIDGQDIKDVTQDSLREHIAVVPQEPLLFHRSIKENIAYGNPSATDAEIEAVARKAQAHDFIHTLPHGYDTLVGERGVKLSGGQRQRIAIARAMLKNAPILVLDEATSALDSESEVAIQTALHELMEGKTVIAIAHRLSTLREMDRIIVLERGKIVEDGTHATLLEEGGIYANLWSHQAGGFLLEEEKENI